jgi:hypothetical protein
MQLSTAAERPSKRKHLVDGTGALTSVGDRASPPRYLSASAVLAVVGIEVDARTAKRRLRSIPPAQLPYHPFGRERLYKEEDVVSYFETRRVA